MFDQFGLGKVIDPRRDNFATVPQDSDAITDTIDLLKPVRNIDDGQAFLFGPLQEREKLVGCLVIQPCRGFIQDQDAG